MDDEALRSTNRRSLDAIMASLAQGDWETVLEYWSEDGLMEVPYGLPGAPASFQGFEAIARNQRQSRDMFSEWATTDVEVHPTVDPSIFFAEYRSRATVRASGRVYENRYVGYFRFDEGKLVHWKEYFNPQVILSTFGSGKKGET